MKASIIEAQYLPPIAFFSALVKNDHVIIEKHEHYQKQTYRNRCYINTAHGREILIVPVNLNSGKTTMADVRIDYTQKWLNIHWRTIQSAYGNAPFFEYFSEDLHRIFYRKFEFLYDLNMELLTMCLKWLKWELPIRESLTYQTEFPDGVNDLRSALTPKKTHCLPDFYRPIPYHQVFGNKFVDNLSLIDLIFCEGPGAAGVVQASSPN